LNCHEDKLNDYSTKLTYFDDDFKEIKIKNEKIHGMVTKTDNLARSIDERQQNMNELIERVRNDT